jgi:mono/diheme cytochrome c family protein
MKKTIVMMMTATVMMLWACGGGENPPAAQTGQQPAATEEKETEKEEDDDDYDASKGIGKFQDVKLSETLDAAKAEKGQTIYDVKCGSCHRLSGPRLVGPSWDGVTKRRKPEWILNFVTNVDEMLAKDPTAMAQLEECLIRMPNQNLSDEDAYAVLEFMRKNDGVK